MRPKRQGHGAIGGNRGDQDLGLLLSSEPGERQRALRFPRPKRGRWYSKMTSSRVRLDREKKPVSGLVMSLETGARIGQNGNWSKRKVRAIR